MGDIVWKVMEAGFSSAVLGFWRIVLWSSGDYVGLFRDELVLVRVLGVEDFL